MVESNGSLEKNNRPSRTWGFAAASALKRISWKPLREETTEGQPTWLAG